MHQLQTDIYKNYLLVVLLITFVSCGFDTHQGKVGVCSTLEDSKKRGVFIEEMLFDKKVISNDSTELIIKNCWLESAWRYGQSYDTSLRSAQRNQLVIEFQPTSFAKRLILDWIIISKHDLSQMSGKVGENSAYITDPNMEQLDFYIIEGRQKVDDTLELMQRYLGSFSLQKSKH